jgi:hypothetical protein
MEKNQECWASRFGLEAKTADLGLGYSLGNGIAASQH